MNCGILDRGNPQTSLARLEQIWPMYGVLQVVITAQWAQRKIIV